MPQLPSCSWLKSAALLSHSLLSLSLSLASNNNNNVREQEFCRAANCVRSMTLSLSFFLSFFLSLFLSFFLSFSLSFFISFFLSAIQLSLSLCVGQNNEVWFLKIDHSRTLFWFIFVLSIQLIVNNIADEWIRISYLWCRNQPLYQLRHNHYFKSLFSAASAAWNDVSFQLLGKLALLQ